MNVYEYIHSIIGEEVYLTTDRDLSMSHFDIVSGKVPLILIRLTKGGRAIVRDDKDREHSVPPSNVRKVGDNNPTPWFDLREAIERGTVRKFKPLTEESFRKWHQDLEDWMRKDVKKNRRI